MYQYSLHVLNFKRVSIRRFEESVSVTCAIAKEWNLHHPVGLPNLNLVRLVELSVSKQGVDSQQPLPMAMIIHCGWCVQESQLEVSLLLFILWLYEYFPSTDS